MSDEELVKWLRNEHRRYVAGTTVTTTGYSQAADRIKALTAENERLNKSAACLAETRRLAVKDVAELEAEIERFRKALEEAPIIGLQESGEAFKSRQDNWLKTKAFPALGEQP